MKSIDTSVSSDAPTATTESLTDPDTAASEPQPTRPAAEPGDDGATTPGGPTMVLLITGSFVLITWLRRRRRKRRSA